MSRLEAFEEAATVYRALADTPHPIDWQTRADLQARMARILMYLERKRDT